MSFSVGSEWKDSSVEAERRREDDDVVSATIKDAKLARPELNKSLQCTLDNLKKNISF